MRQRVDKLLPADKYKGVSPGNLPCILRPTWWGFRLFTLEMVHSSTARDSFKSALEFQQQKLRTLYSTW